MLTDTIEGLLLKNLELLMKVESLETQLSERDVAIDLLMKQRDSFCTRCIYLTEEVKSLKGEETQDGNQS